MKLTREFYLRDGLTVARELIGKKLVTNLLEGLTGGIIVETEAYRKSGVKLPPLCVGI